MFGGAIIVPGLGSGGGGSYRLEGLVYGKVRGFSRVQGRVMFSYGFTIGGVYGDYGGRYGCDPGVVFFGRGGNGGQGGHGPCGTRPV